MAKKFTKKENRIYMIWIFIFLVSIFAINSADWWNSSWEMRNVINVSTGANTPYNGYENYTVQISIDSTDDIYYLDSGNDIRIVYWNGTDNIELDRELIDNNTANTRIRFRLMTNLSASSTTNDYYIYYKNPSATSPPQNMSKVYLWYDDASSNRESEYTQGQLDGSVHGGNWGDTISWNSAGYYDFDTGDNHGDSLRPIGLSERDIYVEYSEYQTDAYQNDMTSGPMVRWQGTGSGDSEDSSHFYYYEMGESLINTGSYSSHDDISHDNRDNVAVTHGTLGFFPTATWIRLGLASWGTNPTNLKAFYENESGGWDGYRFTGTHASGSDNEGAGQFGLWVQQDAGRIDNIIARRYIEPEPSLNSFNNTDYSSNMSIVIRNASTISINYLEQNEILNVTAIAVCSESYQNTCGNISFNIKYNNTASSYSDISTSDSTPMWIDDINPKSCIATGGGNCSVTWQINATGAIDSNHRLLVEASSNMSEVLNSNSTMFDMGIYQTYLISFNQSIYDFGNFTRGTGSKSTTLSLEAIFGDNTNINVDCSDGDCSLITDDWTDGTNINEGNSQNIEFTCSDSTSGLLWAFFNATSDEYNAITYINVSCEVDKRYGPLNGSIVDPPQGTIDNVAQNKTFTIDVNLDCGGTCGNVSAMLVNKRPKTGLSSSDPGDSGWQIKQDYPSSESGVYWIQTEAMASAEQIYIDMDYDGGGWMLIGRGREGWNFADAQQGTFVDVASTPTGLLAFNPDHYSSTFIDQLLNNTNVNALVDGVRIRRANDTAGNTWQEGIWNFSATTNWDWDLDGGGGQNLARYIIDGTDYGSTYDTNDADPFDDKRRTFTYSWNQHDNEQGFSYGSSVCDGANTPSNYLWEYLFECNSIPFTQVYIRPRYFASEVGKMPETYILPLYSISSNPQYCSPTEGGNCSFTWTINATGSVGTLHNLSVVFSSNYSQISSNETGIVSINITNNIDPIINLEAPPSNTKYLGNGSALLTWFVDDNSPTLNCSIFIDDILTKSVSCTSGVNNSEYVNFTRGFHNWTVQVEDPIGSKVNSSTWNITFINNVWTKLNKVIISENTDLYRVVVDVKNMLIGAFLNTTLSDFVHTNFTPGSFSETANWTNISGGSYPGTIYGWNLTIPSNSTENINYSITSTEDYNLVDQYIVGLH